MDKENIFGVFTDLLNINIFFILCLQHTQQKVVTEECLPLGNITFYFNYSL